MRAHRKLHRRPQGLQVVGPGFYLWDPDAREALSLAAELRRRLLAPGRPPRASDRESE
jgi:hypothetical protein